MSHAGTLEVPRLIADARLIPLTMQFTTGATHTVSPSVLKAVLLTLWAHGTNQVPMEMVSEEIGCGLATVFRAIRVMIRDGIIVEVVPGNRRRAGVYAISEARLREYAIKTKAA